MAFTLLNLGIVCALIGFVYRIWRNRRNPKHRRIALTRIYYATAGAILLGLATITRHPLVFAAAAGCAAAYHWAMARKLATDTSATAGMFRSRELQTAYERTALGFLFMEIAIVAAPVLPELITGGIVLGGMLMFVSQVKEVQLVLKPLSVPSVVMGVLLTLGMEIACSVCMSIAFFVALVERS